MATSRSVVRRRRAVLVGLVLAALVVGVVVGGHSGRSQQPGQRAAATPESRVGEPLARQAGQLLLISFKGATAPGYVLRALRQGRVAGVILFGGNAPTAASTRALTAQLQRAAGGDAIVCLDQEGGAIRTLAFAPSAVGQADQATAAAAGAAAAQTAAALRATGINVVLGPVADVAGPGSVMASRAYPGDAAAVTASVTAAVAAYERAGVLPVLKHFPGLGGAIANTDDASVTVDRTRAQLAVDLRPYAVKAPLVMVGHARYPTLEPAAIASQSHAIVTGLLRGRLHFAGVAMTDSLEAQAVHVTGGGVGAAAVRSVSAGIDLLLTTGPGSFLPVRDALLARARRDPAFRARIGASARRVEALRRQLRRPAAG